MAGKIKEYKKLAKILKKRGYRQETYNHHPKFRLILNGKPTTLLMIVTKNSDSVNYSQYEKTNRRKWENSVSVGELPRYVDSSGNKPANNCKG